jgi:hypothetical protein
LVKHKDIFNFTSSRGPVSRGATERGNVTGTGIPPDSGSDGTKFNAIINIIIIIM